MGALRLELLVVAYLVVGAVGAVLVLRRATSLDARAGIEAAAMVALWPLWAPFALSESVAVRPSDHPTVRRILAALDHARRTRGHAATAILDEDDARLIRAEVQRAAERLAEVERLIEAFGKSDARAGGPAEIRAAAVARLHALRDRDDKNLTALAELVELLCTELVLARFAPSDASEDLVTELWARVESLREAEGEARL